MKLFRYCWVSVTLGSVIAKFNCICTSKEFVRRLRLDHFFSFSLWFSLWFDFVFLSVPLSLSKYITGGQKKSDFFIFLYLL